MHDRAMELLSIFHMQDLAGVKAGSLPYGIQRKLEIARALATRPRLLFLDEPAAGMNTAEALELVPVEGTYILPYAASAAGVLYNREMFEEHGWQIPETWDELNTLCEEISAEGILPFYFGFKDIWTCLAPWNALACDLAPADVCRQVNKGETKFIDEYPEVAEKMLELLDHAQDDPFAYNYNDACTAFANGEAAMYCIGSYAVPQIQSVNPDMDIDSFVMPGCDNADDNILNSGVDLQFCITKECPDKEAAYEVLSFLL